MKRRVSLLLVTLALAYAFLAGLRTVGDFDIGWQLATGRYILQHKTFPPVDVFSYTGAGQPWMYSPFSGLLFYLAWLAGGFAAISWLSAAGTVATVAVLLSSPDSRHARLVAAVLAALAVPSIAFRTRPRADLFTTLLFACVLVILWRRHRDRPAPLWMLPILLCLWANLHLGFPAGMMLLAIYVAAESAEWLSRPPERQSIAYRLRTALPWLAAAAMATLLNPYGPGIYQTISAWNQLLAQLEGHIGDWFAVPLSYAILLEALDWRSPASSYWWMLALAVVGVIAGGVVRCWGGVLLLLFGMAASLRYLRFQTVLSMIVVVVLPDVLLAFTAWLKSRPNSQSHRRERPGLVTAAAVVAGLALVALITVRAADLMTQRHYLADGDTVRFGAGVSWWYPERAAEFIRRERLPGRILNDFNLGGYVIWRLGPEYPDAIDGRCLPFGAAAIFENRMLMGGAPDGELWKNFADRWQVNTVLVTTSRYAGAGSTPVAALCASRAWRPVYLDETGAVFLRNVSSNQPLLDRLSIDCSTTRFTPPASAPAAELYNFWANTGNLLNFLGRRAEALEALERARRIFADDPQFYLIRGSVWQAEENLAEAEGNYRKSLALRPNEHSFYALGQVLAVQGRYREAAAMLRRAAAASIFPHEIYRFLGDVLIAAGEPQEALRVFDLAEAKDTYRGAAAPLGVHFRAGLEAGRARARAAMHRPGG